jgi:PAS domain S-box-containing protein
MVLLIIRLLLAASLLLSIYIMSVTLEQKKKKKRYGFLYCCVAIFLYTLGYFIEITCGTPGGAIIGIKIMYAGACFMAPFFFFFSADYCEIRLPKKFYRLPMLIIPVLFYAVVLTFDHHTLLYSDYYYDAEKIIPGNVIKPGPLYLVGTFYPLFCIILACTVLIHKIIKQKQKQRLGLILLVFSALAPLIGNFSYVALSFFSKSVLGQVNFTAFLMVLSNFLFFYNIVRNDMFDLAPKAHAVTLDLIRDIFIVLDHNMAYTGSNNKAMELFPSLTEQYKGKSILQMETWPPELRIIEEKKSSEIYSENPLREIEFTLPHRPGRNYSGWVNRIVSKSGTTLGWVILIQDITETVKMTAALKFFNDQLNKAFSTYLSEDVVKEIIDDPARLQLGGIKRYMTAMFTDIKDFSKIAEALPPEKLVEMLNHYLSAMSNVILDQKGTIDKYEGDAILAFFGAPHQLPDHALRACITAILMKRLEMEVNKILTEKELCPLTVFTRIGINSGEMLVGNMGTQKKMNYTVIGNEVNLAARLEGVNKQYGTRIIASESTINETGGKLLSRRLGWIRVVGISKPVRIYEVLELIQDAGPSLHKLVELFHIALNIFESRKWKNAENAFIMVLKHFPNDNPSKLYLKYCRHLFQNPPPNNWDGVFNIKEK